MYKTLLLMAVCLIGTAVASAQSGLKDLSNYGVRIEPDKRVMVVLATLEAARTTNEAGENVSLINTRLTPEGAKHRDLLKSDLAAIPADLRQRISAFVLQHKRRNASLSDAEIVAPFISMAYALTPVPELADPVVTSDLPGSLLDVLDFAPLVREFYRRSSFSGNLAEYIKTYQRTADTKLRTSAGEMVSEVLTYLNTRPRTTVVERVRTETQGRTKGQTLKNVELRERERSFIIVPDLLAPAGTVNFVNVKDDYFVVVPAEVPDLSFSEARRGFIQFVVDPLIYGGTKEIETIRPIVKRILDERRKTDAAVSPDVYLTISRSLVAAIDARQLEFSRSRALTAQARLRISSLKTEAEKRVVTDELEKVKGTLADETAQRLSEDYEKGAVLAFYFAEQLKGFEGSGFDIASSITDMLLAFDGARETDRLAQFADARKRALAAREKRGTSTPGSVIVENPVTTKLFEIQKLIDARNYAQAGTELKALAAANPAEPRVDFSLGRVASLAAEEATESATQQMRLLEAKAAYERVIRRHLDRIEELNKLRKAFPADSPAVQRAEQNLVDRALVSRSYVALAKIHEFYDERIYAIKIYDEAIKIGNVPEGAFNEATAAKARLVKEQ
jgi:hypothetical protein